MIRTLLVAGFLALLLVALAAMGWGWRRRGARQAPLLGALPAPPPELGAPLLGPHAGLYVGSTFAGSWQDRVVAGGLGRRSAAQVSLYRSGVVLERAGDTPVFLPRAALVGARLAPGLAGKVVGAGGLLVLRWAWSAQQLDTGWRADDRAVYLDWIRALSEGEAA